jgi:hypothetical protein
VTAHDHHLADSLARIVADGMASGESQGRCGLDCARCSMQLPVPITPPTFDLFMAGLLARA